MKMADTASVCSDLDSGIGSCSPTSTGPNTAYIPEHKSVQTFRNTEDYLYAMKEDLAEWLNCLYNLEITVDTFFSSLETGVLLCEHAVHVQDMAEEYRDESSDDTLDRMYDDFGQGGLISRASELRKNMKIPDKGPVYKKNSKAGTFLARDNIANFIAWCRALGIPDTLLFETEDLVSRKNEKSVVLCLLEVARQGSKFGMLVPCLIQLEQEIDAEIRGEPPPPPPPMKPKEPEVFKQKITCDMRSLDEMVRDLVSQCVCHIQFPVIRVSEGKYMVGEQRTLIFVRILRNHVMVRVGGGWDTFGNYLNKHDPCRDCRNHRILAKTSTTPLSQKRRGSAPPQSLSVFKPKESPRKPEVSSTRLRKLSQSSEDILSDDSEASSSSRSRSGTLKRGDVTGGHKPQRTSSFRKPTSSKSSDQLCNGGLTPTPSTGIPQRASRETSVPTGPSARRRLSMDSVSKSTPSSASADSSPAMTRKQRSGSQSIELSENYSNLQSKTDQLQNRLRELDNKGQQESRQRRGSTPTSKSLDFSRYQSRSTTPGPETPRQRKISGDLAARLQRRPTTPSSDSYRERPTTQGGESRRCTTPGPESRIARRSVTPGPESSRCTSPGPGNTTFERRPTTPQPQRRKISEPSNHRRSASSQPGTPVMQRRAQAMTTEMQRHAVTPSTKANKLSRSGSFRTSKELRSNSVTNGHFRRSQTPEPQSSKARLRSGSMNNIDSAKLSVNYDEIEDIGGNEQLYQEMEKLFNEYKEQEQAKSSIEDELDRRIRDKIKPDVEKYKEKQAQKVKDSEIKRDRTSSLNQNVSESNVRSDQRRASTSSLNNNSDVPKNGLRSSSAANSHCQISNSKLSKSASKPLEPRSNTKPGSSPSTAVVPPFSYTKSGVKEKQRSEGEVKKSPVEEEHDPESKMKKTRSDVERELEQRIRAKLDAARKTPERSSRSNTPTPGKSVVRGRTPDRGRPPERGQTPERGRTPVRGLNQVRGRTPDRESTSRRGTTPDRSNDSESGKTERPVASKVNGWTNESDRNQTAELSSRIRRSEVSVETKDIDNDGDRAGGVVQKTIVANVTSNDSLKNTNLVGDRGRISDRGRSGERGKTPDRSKASERGRSMDRGKVTERGRTPDRVAASQRGRSSSYTSEVKKPEQSPTQDRVVRSKTPDPIARQRRCQTPDPFTRSRKMDSERSRPQVRSKTPEPFSNRKRFSSTGSADSSERSDSNADLYASFDRLSNFNSDSSDNYRYGSIENLAKVRKDEKDAPPTRIPGPMGMRKSATCSGSLMSLESFDSFEEDDEVRSFTKNAENYHQKRHTSAPDVLRLKMQSPLITGRSTIVNKKLPSPTKEKKPDGIKAMTAIHFV